MKMKKRAIVGALVVGLLAAGSSSVSALTESQTTTIKKDISSVPPVELAAKAVEMVNGATKKDKADTAVEIMRNVAKRNPSAAISVFSAITAVAPELTVKVAAVLVEILPTQAESVARLAAQSSPENASEIIAQLGAVAPREAGRISQAVNTSVAINASANTPAATTVAAADRAENTTRAYPPGLGNLIIIQRPKPINLRVIFPIIPPRDISNYAAPGFDPNRP